MSSDKRAILPAANKLVAPGWWQSPVSLYLSLALFHPQTQTTLWRALESSSILPFDTPASTIIASLDSIYFVGTMLWYRLFWSGSMEHPEDSTNKRRGGFNSASSSSSQQQSKHAAGEEESELYLRKRAMNFKDPILHDFIQTCQSVKQQLRPVQDPLIARKEKLAQLRHESRTAKAAPGPLQLSETRLQKERQRLNKTGRGEQLLQ